MQLSNHLFFFYKLEKMDLNLISLFNFNINFSQVSTTSFGEIKVNLTFSILSFASVKKAGRGGRVKFLN